MQPLTLGNRTNAISGLGQQGTIARVAYLIAAGAAVVCLASRSPDEPTLAWATGLSPHSLAPLPFVVGVAVLAAFGMQDIGAASADVAFLPAFLLALGAFFLYAYLPTLGAAVRRVAVLPMVLVSSAIFNGLMFETFSQIDRSTLIQASLGMPVFVLLFSGSFYLFFIFSPAQIADPRGSWTDWSVRYALFVLSSLVGVSALGAIRR